MLRTSPLWGVGKDQFVQHHWLTAHNSLAASDTTVITVTSPPGVFAIREGQAKWEPAVDATRVALLAIGTGLAAATLAGLAMVHRPPWPDVRLRR